MPLRIGLRSICSLPWAFDRKSRSRPGKDVLRGCREFRSWSQAQVPGFAVVEFAGAV